MLYSQNKVVALDTDKEQIKKRCAELNAPLVFTNGCFDILHRGHVTYLEQARNLGGSLIVGVNSDASIKRLNKGDDRPINCLEDRMAVLASLECVDMAISFGEDTPFNLISIILPKILVKGGDWPVDEIVGADVVQANGGDVHSLAFKYDRSTTKLLNKVKSAC